MLFTLVLLVLIVGILLAIYARLTVGRCYCNTYLAGKTVLITGGNSGLGYKTALTLAGRGCRIIIADKDNCEETKAKIIKITGNKDIVIKQFDLSSFKSIRALAKDINESEERLDILINNAGVGSVQIKNSEDGLNVGMQINHFGSFLLTHLLIDLLKKSAPSKIIFVTSTLSFLNNLSSKNLNWPAKEESSLNSLRIYANSKLCNIITAQELGRKLRGTGVSVNSVHPGLVDTPIFYCSTLTFPVQLMFSILVKCFAKTPVEGAQTAIHVALSQRIQEATGEFFADCKVHFKPFKAADPKFCKTIWEISEQYTKLSPKEIIN